MHSGADEALKETHGRLNVKASPYLTSGASLAGSRGNLPGEPRFAFRRSMREGPFRICANSHYRLGGPLTETCLVTDACR